MKVIFLDCDGVICLDTLTFEDLAMKNLRKIIRETGSHIVISSSWRFYDDSMDLLLSELDSFRIPRPIGSTPIFQMRTERHKEIQHWLSEHPEVTKFAILDDWDEAKIPEKPESFFLTGMHEGLSEYITEKVIKYLNE